MAIAATFLSVHYRASAMLFALLLGMALNFLTEEGQCRAGIQVASSHVLRIGVALLGLKITVDQVVALGWEVVVLVVVAVVATVLVGLLVARAMKLTNAFGTLTGGAVAICGVSAALAIASILPKHQHAERDASFTAIGVTALSTLAMIVYPLIVGAFGLNQHEAGIFLGGTIHDVAQVVGAGYSVSQDTGDTATIVKLLRVGMLLPVCLAIGVALHVRGSEAARSAPLLPWFAVVFAILVVVNSLGFIPKSVADAGNELSRWFLVTAIAAIGMKTSIKSLIAMGLKPVMLVVLETVFLAALVMAAIHWR
ncbi:putative sulfate exporter family transporter [Usitatibacter rugosus]|uniref:YeiH family protein n=1 Tax=Usitatibacter rugosus TaxID=2732067 RepID=UPI001BB1156D